MSSPEFFSQPISKSTIQRLADEGFGNMVKFVVDVQKRLIGAGGAMHVDIRDRMIERGSAGPDLWGANFYLDRPQGRHLQYTSMINNRPDAGNTTQDIKSPTIRTLVGELADYFFAPFHARS